MFSDVDGPATPPTQLELYDTLRTKFVEAQRFIEADEQFAEFIGEPLP